MTERDRARRLDLATDVPELTEQIQARYASKDAYVAFNAPRYAFLLKLLHQRFGSGSGERVLDVGTSAFAQLLTETFDFVVETMDVVPLAEAARGYDQDPAAPGAYHVFDLNETPDPERWPQLGTFTVVLLSEVIEHLRVSPTHVFGFLRTLMTPSSLLVVQTPNAASINKRAKLLLGRNPYELIHEDPAHLGHIREYTCRELEGYATAAGLDITAVHFGSYFDARFRGHIWGQEEPVSGGWRNRIYSIVPPSLRLGMTLELRLR